MKCVCGKTFSEVNDVLAARECQCFNKIDRSLASRRKHREAKLRQVLTEEDLADRRKEDNARLKRKLRLGKDLG